MIQQKKAIGKAFYKTVPVMAGYIVLGTGFGTLLRNAGYGMLWALSMSLFIYVGIADIALEVYFWFHAVFKKQLP